MNLFLKSTILPCFCLGLLFFGIPHSIYSLTITPPKELNKDAPIVNPAVDFSSYINPNQSSSISYLSFGNEDLNNFAPLFLVNNYVAPPEIDLKIVKDFLFYPNPFRLIDNTQIGFELSKDVHHLEIQIYDLRGLNVFSGVFQSMVPGQRYNKYPFSHATFGQPIPNMSSGVYIFLIRSEGEILGKGKFVVKP